MYFKFSLHLANDIVPTSCKAALSFLFSSLSFEKVGEGVVRT